MYHEGVTAAEVAAGAVARRVETLVTVAGVTAPGNEGLSRNNSHGGSDEESGETHCVVDDVDLQL